MRSDVFRVTVNTAFKATIAGCAAPQTGREDTWINKRIRDLRGGLHNAGPLPQRRSLAGRRSGRGASTASASGAPSSARACSTRCATLPKWRWCISVARLIEGGFELLDTQYVTEHLKSFGAVEVSRRRYTALLDKALVGEPADFLRMSAGQSIPGARALEIIASRQ